MSQDYTEIFNLAHKLMIEDVEEQIRVRLEDDYDIVTLHTTIGRYLRDKYLWGHHEYCNFLRAKYSVTTMHPDDLTHRIVNEVYTQKFKNQD